MSSISIGAEVSLIGIGGDFDVGGACFNGCANLLSISVDSNNPIYWSIDGVLYGRIPDSDDVALLKYPTQKDGKTFVIPSDVTIIGAFAFEDNDLLQSIKALGQVKKIGSFAFNSCGTLSMVYLMSTRCPYFGDNFYAGTSPRGLTICYDPSSMEENGWEEYEKTQTTQHGEIILYSIEPFAGFPIENTDTGYYAVVVIDKVGNPINNIKVSLSEDIDATTNQKGTSETVKAQAGIAMFYNLDYYDADGNAIAYSLKVVDTMGEYFPFENKSFYLDELTRITYVTLSSVPTVSGVSAEYAINSAEKIKKILTDDAAATVVGDGYKVLDMNSQTAKINRWLTDQIVFTLSCGIDKDDSIDQVKLIQDNEISFSVIKIVSPGQYEELSFEDAIELGKTIEGGKIIVTLHLLVLADSLVNEKDLYAEIATTSGLVKAKLNAHIYELNFYSIDLSWLANGASLPISPTLAQILKGFGRELSIKPIKNNNKFKIKVKASEDSFKVAIQFGEKHDIGLDAIDENDEWGQEYLSDKEDKETGRDLFWEHWDTLVNQRKLTTFQYSKEKKSSYYILGSLEVKYKGIDENGKPDISVTSCITGAIGFTYSFGATYQVVVVPVRVEIEIGAEAQLNLKFVFDKEAEKFITPDFTIKLKGEFSLSAGVGFSFVSAGVYGKAETIVILKPNYQVILHPLENLLEPSLVVKEWTLEGDVGFYVKYSGLIVKWRKEWSILKALGVDAKWVIYKDGKWWFEKDNKPKSASYNSILYDESNYSIATSSAKSRKMRLSLNPDENSDYWSDESAHSGMTPKMLRVGDKIYIFYQEDLARFDETTEEYLYTSYKDSYNYSQYDKYNYQKIVYQIYDTKTNTLSDEVYVLDDNGYSDGSFDVYNDGSNAVVIYSQMNKRLTEEDDLNDLSSYVGSMDIKTAAFSGATQKFVAAETKLTDDEFYDYSIHTGVVNGKLTAVWIQNQANSMFGATEDGKPSNVLVSTYEYGAWSVPSVICTADTLITDLELGENGIAYIIDVNNDLSSAIIDDEIVENTFTDRIVHILDFSDLSNETVSEEDAYFDVSYVDGTFVYYLNGNLYTVSKENGEYAISIDENAAMLNQMIENLPSEYQIVEDSDGKVKAIVYVGSEDNGSNLYGIFCSENVFGSPVKLTNYGENEYVQSFDISDFGDKMMLSVLVSTVDFSEAELVENESGEDALEGEVSLNETYRFEAKFVDYPTGYEVGEITFDYDAVAPNNDLELSIPITNKGYESLQLADIPVTINGVRATNLGFFDGEDEEYEDGILPSGVQAYLKVSFNPGSVTENEYSVVVGKDTPSETTQSVKIWYSDFVVNGKQIIIGGQYYVIANVTNIGYLSGQYHLTAKYNDTVIFEAETDLLTRGQSQYFAIPLDDELIHEDTCIVTIGVNADSEYYTTNNLLSVNVSIAPELQSDEVSISPRQIRIDRSRPNDISIEFSSEELTLEHITVGDEDFGAFVQETNSEHTRVTLSSEYLLSHYSNGTYGFVFNFSSGDKATARINIYETFEIRWDIDGKVEAERYETNAIPSHATPYKDGDAEYESYEFIGWDKAVEPVSRNESYIAVFKPGNKCTYTVTWNVDGAKYQETYFYGEIPSDADINKVKPVGIEYSYEFDGWDKPITEVTENTQYVAQFKSTLREYTVTWEVNGTVTKETYPYGDRPSPDNIVTDKSPDPQYTYIFAGWDHDIDLVTGDTIYVAIFTKKLNTYEVWWVVDGATYEETYEYGATPSYKNVVNKDADAQYTYTFYGWDKEITPVVSDTEYVAVFSETVNCYTITWVVNGNTYTQTYAYGQTPVFDERLFEVVSDKQHCNLFQGWDKEIVSVTGEETYTAVFEARDAHDFTDTIETSENGIEYIVHTCECGYVEYELSENVPQIIMESKTAMAGSTVKVTVNLQNNPGIASMRLKVFYDSALTLTNVTYNTTIGGQFQQPQSFGSPVTLNWFNGAANATGDFVFATLTFQVADDAIPDTMLPITVEYAQEDVYNIDETDIEFFVSSGAVKVINYIPGDINGDLSVNNKDLTRLFQYLSDWDVEVNENALDVNGDGNVNNKDLTRLFQFLSDWDVKIY
ncbi:MAG: hypothetical protein E7680_07700 [Ruminococcaceae bacterium]|nr:hypothetical protein [Oscillospiraceae bacterium]